MYYILRVQAFVRETPQLVHKFMNKVHDLLSN